MLEIDKDERYWDKIDKMSAHLDRALEMLSPDQPDSVERYEKLWKEWEELIYHGQKVDDPEFGVCNPEGGLQ